MISSLNYHKNEPYKEMTKRLNVEDYAFEINGKDINNCFITYSFDSYESTIYKNGKKIETKTKPIIDIEISSSIAGMTIEIDMSLEIKPA